MNVTDCALYKLELGFHLKKLYHYYYYFLLIEIEEDAAVTNFPKALSAGKMYCF